MFERKEGTLWDAYIPKLKCFVYLLYYSLLPVFAVNADGLLNTERYQSVNVQPGDTLWSIASRNVSEETDIRAYVFELQEINHISNPGTITPGQSILIPRK